MQRFNLQLKPDIKGFSVPRNVAIAYGAVCTAAIVAAYFFGSQTAAVGFLCIALCGFMLLDIVMEFVHQPPQERARQIRAAVICAAATVCIIACVAAMTGYI